MKKKRTNSLILAVIPLILSSGIAFSAGPLDGIYTCHFSSVSGSISQIYISVNSNVNTTVITIPNLPGVLYYGYVAGSAASETAFSGTSNYGYPFSATATGAVGAKILYVNGTIYTAQYGPVSGTGTCSQTI